MAPRPILEIESVPPEKTETATAGVLEDAAESHASLASVRKGQEEDAQQLEARWRASTDTRERLEIASELAAENEPETVRAIGRLLQVERHPKLRRALLSALAEIDPSVAVEERLGIVQTALRSPSPQLRAIALTALESLDDRRVAPLLHRLSREDLDSTVRVVAAKMLQVRGDTDAALSGDGR